jgi:hypothetical protein
MTSEAQHLIARMKLCGGCGKVKTGILVAEQANPEAAAVWFGKCTACGIRTAEATTIVHAYEGWQSLARIREERDELLEERSQYREIIKKLQGVK